MEYNQTYTYYACDRDAPTKILEKVAVLPTSNIWNLWNTKKVDISNDWFDVEQSIAGTIWWDKEPHKKMHAWHFMMKKPLYLKTDALGVSLAAGLLQVREGMSCFKNTIPDSAILRSIAFASKNLSIAETCYSNIEGKSLSVLYSCQKFQQCSFARGTNYHGPWTPGHHIQEIVTLS